MRLESACSRGNQASRNLTGSCSKAILRSIISTRARASGMPRISTERAKRSSSCGRRSPSSGFIVPTKIKRAGWLNEMPSRSTMFIPIAAESSRISTTWSSSRLTSSIYSSPRLAAAKTPGSKWRSPFWMARSISSVPTTRSSVAETGRLMKGVGRRMTGKGSLEAAARSMHSVHQWVGSCGSQPKRQPSIASSSGRRAAKARAAVDLAVPRSPRMSTPPMRGSTALSTRARRMRSCPTIAVKG